MGCINSKCSRGDLTPPSPKRLNLEDSTSSLAQIEMLMEEMGPQTSPESQVDRVLRIPDELLTDIFACFAADSDLEALLNQRLVCKLWKRKAFFALKSNVGMLPKIVGNDDLMCYFMCNVAGENYTTLRSLESCIQNLKPGCGLPLQLVVNEWTPELESFLRNYSSDIVGFWICGDGGVFLDRFPADLGGIELPSLEHATFSASRIRNAERVCDIFTKALAFWKELVKVSKNIKTSIRISLEPFMDAQTQLSCDHNVFDLLDWRQVDSLSCNVEFFLDLSATHELPALRNLACNVLRIVRRPLQTQVSLEKVPNLVEMTFNDAVIEWNLNHPMKNLRVLTLRNTINCEQSSSELLPNLKKITIVDYGTHGDFMDNGPFACLLLVNGGGVFEKAVELKLTDECFNVGTERLSELAVQLCESLPRLKKLEWFSLKSPPFDTDNKNALKAAPHIFSKLENLTRLVLAVSWASDREVVELITGISLEEIPEEEESWPSALDGNPRSITNLKNLQSFVLRLMATFIRTRKPTVSMRHTRFLFTAALRTMPTLEELLFNGITFEDRSWVAEWRQMGRTIYIEDDDDSSSGSGGYSFTMDSDSELSGDGDDGEDGDD